jgi:hypothetical protein
MITTKFTRCLLIVLAILVGASAVVAAQTASDPFRLVTVHRKKAGYWNQSIVYAHINSHSQVAQLANHLIWEDVKAAMKVPSDPKLWMAVSDGEPHDPYAEKPDEPRIYQYRSTVSLCAPRLISVYNMDYADTGGRETIAGYGVTNVGYKDGKPAVIALRDLFKPGIDAADVTGQLVFAKLKENPDATLIRDGSIKRLSPDMIETFVLTRSGITFIFGTFAISERRKDFFVKIPYVDFGDKLDPRGPLQGLISE